MRIELALPGLSVGGTEKMVVCLAQGLAKKGHAIQVVMLKNKGPLDQTLHQSAIPVVALGTPEGFWPGLWDLPRLSREFRRATFDFKPEVVHTFLTRTNVLVRYALAPEDVPVRIGSLRVMEQEKSFHLWGERWRSAPPYVYTVNSRALKEFAIQSIGLAADQIQVIYNGVAPLAPAPPAQIQQVKRDVGVEGKRFILAAGRLHAQKGFDLLITAFAVLAPKNPDLLLLIAGEGPERSRLQTMIQKQPLEKRIRLLGNRDDLPLLLQACDLYVLSSRWEGTPNVVLEAMAAGASIVSTSVGGVQEIFSADEGWIVEPNATALTQGIAAALQAPEASIRRQKARARAASFSMEHMVDQHIALYESLLKRSPGKGNN